MSAETALDDLEARAIEVLREAAACFDRVALLFSGGKDSICLLRLAEKAFRPARFPMVLLHIDTGHNFAEVIDFRDRRARELGERLVVRSVEETIAAGRAVDTSNELGGRNRLQIATLRDAITELGLEALVGGARRDEEKARAKERVFSFRDAGGQWDPKRQRPELFGLYNTRIRPGEHMRVFPLSDFTEIDVWRYIERERLEVPSLYFSHERAVVRRKGLLFPVSALLPAAPAEAPFTARVRFRTVGDMTCTACVESGASSVADVIDETLRARSTERGATRADDRVSAASMEDRKREGYF